MSLAFVLFTAGKCSKDKYEYTESTYVEMATTGCFGTCPVYLFSMKGNGMATFNGKMNIKPEGEHSRTFPADTTNAVFNRLLEADLYQYENEYSDDVTDLPTTYLTFSHEGKKKKIKMYYGVPKDLKAATEELKSFVLSADWQAKEVVK
jgi:hypothetical protein